MKSEIANSVKNDKILSEINGNNTINEQKVQLVFPYYDSGEVVKGFGRGSKELGIPTANFPDDVVNKLPEMYQQGVYFGWANVDNGPVYKMVMSIGNNPYFNNEKRTMETHILHKFDKDFYGSQLKIVMTGYLRAMTNFKCLGKI